MLSCWRVNPESRPLFDVLEKRISSLLANGVAEHYIDLNEPYLQSNVINLGSGKTDYFALMGTPDCQPPKKPNYVYSQQRSDTSAMSPHCLTTRPSTNNISPKHDVDTHDLRFSATTDNLLIPK